MPLVASGGIWRLGAEFEPARGRRDGLAVRPDGPVSSPIDPCYFIPTPRFPANFGAARPRVGILDETTPHPAARLCDEVPARRAARLRARACGPGGGRGDAGGVSGVAGGNAVQRTDIHLCSNGGVAPSSNPASGRFPPRRAPKEAGDSGTVCAHVPTRVETTPGQRAGGEGGGYTPQDPYGLFGTPLAGPASGRVRPGGLRKRRGTSIPRTNVRRKATHSVEKLHGRRAGG